MADKKISQLTTLAQVDVAPTADFLPIVDTGSSETKKVTPQALVLAAVTNQTVELADGSAGTPSLTNDGDENTGLFFPAADTVAVSTGGTERARVDSSGNLGIGTASPSYRLDISRASFGVTAAFRSVDGTNNPRVIVYGSATESTIQATSSTGANTLSLATGGGEGSGTVNLQIDVDRNVTAGGGTLATSATNGFLYVPTCAGTPTGTPTAKTGYAPIVVNTTNNKLYFYSGGAWRDAGP